MKRLVLILLLLAGVTPALSQAIMLRDGEGTGVEDALEALEEAGHTIVVVPPEAAEGTPAEVGGASFAEEVAALRMALHPVLDNAPSIPRQLLEALERAGEGSLAWLVPAALIVAVSLALGALAYGLAARLVARVVGAMGEPSDASRAARIARAFAVFLCNGVGTAAFFFTGIIAAVLIRPELSPERVTVVMIVSAITTFLAFRAMVIAVLSPGDGALRVVPLSDRLASSLATQTLTAMLVSNAVVWLCFWFAHFPLPEASHQFLLMAASVISAAMFTLVALAHRRELTALILGDAGRSNPLRRILAVSWPVLAIGYFWSAAVANVVAVAEDKRLVLGPVLGPTIALVVGLSVVGLLILLHDRRLVSRNVDPAWTGLFEKAAVGIAAIAAIATLLASWRSVEGEQTWAVERQLIGIAVAGLIGWVMWRAVSIFVALRLEDEQGPAGPSEESEGFGQGASRLATLLPIFRNFVLFVIASVLLMIGLASLGVDVAPLFAGAGVVGLAIGFGAQALIRDAFSGAFFLLDDAFRRGEYVEVGGVTGQVEKISVRSFQLRHHEGALHTLPFGEIKQLTNYSRDWVIMKLPVRVTYDTDIEMMRKLIKKLGQEMAAEPELGPLFLEPPKSQGVVHMEDNAMIVRIKFKTRPGDQFLVRRHVYQRLRELFAERGIKFAHREVTVRVAGEQDDPSRARAAAAAVGGPAREGDPATLGTASDLVGATG